MFRIFVIPLISLFVAMAAEGYDAGSGAAKVAGKMSSLQDSASQKQKAGDLAGAIADYTKALEAKPKDSHLYFLRGTAKYAKDDLQGALEDFNRSIELDAVTSRAYFERGLVKRDLQDFEGSIVDLTKTIEIDPKFYVGYYSRGRTKMLKGDWEGAKGDFDRAASLNPADAEFVYWRAVCKLELGDFDGGIEDCTLALDLDAEMARAHASRAYCWMAKQAFDKALADFDRALEIEPSSSEYMVRRGNCKSLAGDSVGAMADFGGALKSDPRNSFAYLYRGKEKFKAGEMDAAMKDFDLAILVDPQFVDALGARAILKYKIGDLLGTILDYDRVINLHPTAVSYYNRGLAKIDYKSVSDGIADFRKALELDPEMVQAYFNLAIILDKTGDRKGAIDLITWKIEKEPENPEHYRMRARCRWLMGNYDEALSDTDVILKLDPNHAGAMGARGCIWYSKGDFEAALRDYQQHITRAKDEESQEYERLFVWLLRSREGRSKEADAELRAFVESLSKDEYGWVHEITKFLLQDDSDAQEFLAKAKTPKGEVDNGLVCEAWYYIGMKQLYAGDHAAATESLQKCLATKEDSFTEYHFAQAELDVLAKE